MPSSARPPTLTLTLTLTLVLTLSPLLFALRPPAPSPSPSSSPYRRPPPPPPKISKANPTDLRLFPTTEPCPYCPSNRHDHDLHHRRPATPPRRENELNFGEKLGLLFSGVIILLQIGFAGFLIFKRLQLRKLDDEVALGT